MPNKRVLNRKLVLAFLLFLIVLFNGCQKESNPVVFPSEEIFVAYFSPNDPLYPHLIYLIDEAKESIYAAFYKIELEELARALTRAHQRGIKVKIFTDDLTSQDQDSQFNYLAKFGLVKKDRDPDSFMHHKFCVIDERIGSSEGKFNKNKFFLIPSLVVNLPDDWQDNFTGADNLKCLTLYPSKDELNPLRELSRRNKQSISPAVREAVDNYFRNKSWRVNIFPQTALKHKSCRQLSTYLFEDQISKLKYLSSQTNRSVINLVTEAISRYCS